MHCRDIPRCTLASCIVVRQAKNVDTSDGEANVSEPLADLKREIDETQREADAGDLRAQTRLAYGYLMGDPILFGVDRDESLALKWFLRLEAATRDPSKQKSIARLYGRGGKGLEPDAEKSAYWYRKAALRDDAEALVQLAWLLASGRGVTQSFSEAAVCFRKAAENGDSFGMYGLASLYLGGGGVQQSDEKAAYWFERAESARFNPSAAMTLAHLGLQGRGLPRDQAEIYRWLAVAGTTLSQVAGRLLDELVQTMSDEEILEAQRRTQKSIKLMCDDEDLPTTGLSLLALYGLDRRLSEQDDPHFWEAVLRKHWYRPYGPKLSLLGQELWLHFAVVLETSTDPTCWGVSTDRHHTIEGWDLIRKDVRHLQPVEARVSYDCPGTSYTLIVSRPSRTEPQAVVQSSNYSNPLNNHGDTRVWSKSEEGVWTEGRSIGSWLG